MGADGDAVGDGSGLQVVEAGTRFKVQPLNLGSGTEITIRELAETIIEMTGSSSRLVFEPLPEDDPRQRMPDITLAGELLDWIPATPLEDGLRETINYFQKRVA